VRKVDSRAKPCACLPTRVKPTRSRSSNRFPRRGDLALNQHGGFVDLCAGPHIERTGQIKAFKVLSFAGAIGARRIATRSSSALRHGLRIKRMTFQAT